MPDPVRRFARLVVENRQARKLHRENKRGIEALACAIRERALLDAHKALTGQAWKDTANG